MLYEFVENAANRPIIMSTNDSGKQNSQKDETGERHFRRQFFFMSAPNVRQHAMVARTTCMRNVRMCSRCRLITGSWILQKCRSGDNSYGNVASIPQPHIHTQTD